MNWNEIKITTIADAVEAISYELMDLDIQGIEIMDPKEYLMRDQEDTEWDYIEESLLKNIDSDQVVMKCYLSEDENLDHYLAEISRRLDSVKEFLPIGEGLIEVKKVKEEQWAHNWKKYFKPFRIGDNIVIKPTWETYDGLKEDDILIEIDPGMAFGTGTHETTSLCVEMIEKYLAETDRVIDIGCGTGILSIAAAKLGAKDIVGVDIDENAVRAAKENVVQNQVSTYVDILLGNLLDLLDGEAELIVANIMADVIINMADIVPQFLKRDGKFIASGIILDKKDAVKEALSHVGLIFVEEKIKGEWAVLVYTKKA